VIVDKQRMLVERLHCEKISLHGICRAIGVALTTCLVPRLSDTVAA
jgi:hypothetical protein